MIYTIKGEQPIQILTDAFSIGPSSEGYVLQISSDGYNYSDLFSVGPNVTRLVTNVAAGSYYRLKGNASEVDINWIKNCGGGSGSGPQGAQGPQGPAGGGEGGDSHVLLSSSAIPQNLQSGDVFAKADGVYQTKIEKTDKVSYLLSLTEMKSQEAGEVWFATPNEGEICTFMQQNSVWGFYDRGAGVFYPESAFSDWAPKDGISNSNLQFIINGDDVYAVSDASEILIYLSGAKPYVGTITQGMGAKVYKIVGGKYSLPIASETQLGGVKIGSGITIDAEGHISAQGGGTADMDILKPVSALPSNSWTTWADNVFTAARETCTNDGDYLIHWNDGGNYTGARIANGVISEMPYGGNWQLGADGKYHSSEWEGFTCWTENGKLYWMGVPSVISMLDAYDKGSDKEGYVVNIDANGSVRATSGGTYQVMDDEWKKLGGYDIDGALCIWNPETGYTAEWLSPLTSLETNNGDGLIYAEIPENQVLFEARQGSGEWVKAVYTKDTLSFVNSADTVLSAITIGSDFEIQLPGSTSRKLIGTFQKHYIGLRKNDSGISFQNVWDGSVNGGHYELADKTNYGYVEASNGIPKWNDKGQIIGKERGVSYTYFFVNTTASTITQRTTLYGDGTMHLPSRIFVPTNGGNEGQVLTSAGGNAEPVWATMIKALQITSADYEALTVKDPNTLYLIVD